MEFLTALLALCCLGLLSVGVLVAFFVLRKTVKTAKILLLLSLLGIGALALAIILAALLAPRG